MMEDTYKQFLLDFERSKATVEKAKEILQRDYKNVFIKNTSRNDNGIDIYFLEGYKAKTVDVKAHEKPKLKKYRHFDSCLVETKQHGKPGWVYNDTDYALIFRDYNYDEDRFYRAYLVPMEELRNAPKEAIKRVITDSVNDGEENVVLYSYIEKVATKIYKEEK